MSYSHLLSSESTLATFRATYNVPEDVDIAYCTEGERHRGVNTIFFPLMAILKGGVRFLVDPFLLDTLRFYGLYLDQPPLTFIEW